MKNHQSIMLVFTYIPGTSAEIDYFGQQYLLAPAPTQTSAPATPEADKGGKGDAFILMRSGSFVDEARPVNLKAMVDSAKKHGW